jgi:hypothetical protein
MRLRDSTWRVASKRHDDCNLYRPQPTVVS